MTPGELNQETDRPAPGAPDGGLGPLVNWADQDETLRALWFEGVSPEDISEKLGRSPAAIMTRAARLGLPRRTAPGRKRGFKRSEPSARAKPVRVVVQVAPVEDVRPSQAMMRVCLMCLSKFQSEGRHNRICPSCKGSAEYATGASTPDFTFSVGA